jgi:hypothetical protein
VADTCHSCLVKPEPQSRPRAARAAWWLRFGVWAVFAVLAVLHMLSAGWAVLLVSGGFFLAVVEWFILDGHRHPTRPGPDLRP